MTQAQQAVALNPNESHAGEAIAPVHGDVSRGLGLDGPADGGGAGLSGVGFQIMATLVGGVLLICSFVAQFIFDTDFNPTALSFVAAILLGAPLVWVGVKDLIEGHMHMNELVALAVLAAFAAGKYFEAASIAFFMIISVLIENRTAMGAKASIESLVRITPTRASKLTDGVGGNQEVEADARDLQPGDVVRVRPGDNIPADGRVVRGTSTVNQANITGESLPAEKTDNDEVFGGTINLTGVMDVEVTKAGGDTTLGRVKDLILQAESTRIPIMRMIDQYAGWYTPTVLMLVFIVWFFRSGTDPEAAISAAIAMLVVACPCPIILATPTAMVAALSAASRLGVLVKSVVDLEAARSITAIIFDKTGTLTTGQLEVTRLTPGEGVDGTDLLKVAASVEQNSRHPVAKAVVSVARKAQLMLPTVTDFHEQPGQGVRGVVDGQTIQVGRASWLEQSVGEQTRAALGQALAEADTEGVSVLFVVREDHLLGWIGLADNARVGAAGAVDELRELGIKRTIMVTGDRESVAKRVAGQLHTEYKAEVLPSEKLDMVDALKARGHRVAVIGDGVNDAPALAAGDISIAMGAAGSDVAVNSASIALMNNNLNRVPFLIQLSRRTSAVIKQNLLIGGGFIIVFMALAAANYVTAITAAVLHVVSGLIVIFNSARLVRTGEDIEHAEHAELIKAERGAARGTAQAKQADAAAGDVGEVAPA